MATFAAVKQKPSLNLGSIQGGIWKVTHDGTIAYFHTGLNHVMFACVVSEDSSNEIDQVVFDSNDGTAGTDAGSVWFTVETDGDITYFMVLGR